MATASFDPTVLLRSEQAGGHVSVVENRVPARWAGPPLHLHDFDETFYVLDGQLTFQVRDDLLTAGPGELAFAPGGVAHTLANVSGEPARYLLICTPAGFERYFGRVAAERAGVEAPEWALQPTPEVTTVGPQIAGPASAARRASGRDPKTSIAVLLRSEETGGRISVMDNVVPAGAKGPYLHKHDFDEAFHMLEGELTFRVADELITVRRGQLAFAPRGVPHTFTNRSGAAARFALVCTPAGFERHFARLAAQRAGVEAPEWALQPIPEVTRVGPRIGEPAQP